MNLKSSPQSRTRLALVSPLIAWALLAHPVEGSKGVEATQQRGLEADKKDCELEVAARAYEEAMRLYTEQRSAAATALYRLAEAQRRLGHTNLSTANYEQLVREFPEQSSLVGRARVHLPAVAAAARAGDASIAANLAEQEKLLREDLAIAEQMANEAQSRADAGAIAPLEVLVPAREVLRLQRQLLQLTDPNSAASRKEQRTLLSKEIEFAERWAEATRIRVLNGRGSAEEALLARRAVLETKRAIAASNATRSAVPLGPVVVEPSQPAK